MIMEFKDVEHQDINQIFMSKDKKGAWDLRVKKTLVEKWIKEGLN